MWKPVDLSGGTLVKGEQYWDPADYGCRQFAPGRPGWHIECSAMSRTELGDQIDLHCGGLDLIFPHHDNEIAQSEACTGAHPFSQVWMHNGFVNVSGEKMSKSLGNFSTIAELLTVYDANTIRYFILTNKYRSPVDFNEAALDSAQNWVKKRARPHTYHV
ncbi:MAG: class I tRNA ligase family protein [Vampirovibrionales bacterium]